MSSEPAISVIMPVYNTDEPYLRYSIKSILEQPFKDFELIIVNDGSVNNSEEVILSIKDDRIRYFKQENSGQGCARNNGLKVAKGKYVIFIDADDWISSRTFDVLFHKAELNNLDILNFGVTSYNIQNGFKNIWMHDVYEFDKSTCFSGKHPEIIKRFFRISQTCWGKLYRREFLIENNLFFVEGLIFEDIEYIPRCLLKAKRMMFMPAFLYFYRINVSESTMTSGSRRHFNIVQIFNYIEQTLKDYGLFESLRINFYDYKVVVFTRLYHEIKPIYADEYYEFLTEDLNKAQLTKQDITKLGKYNTFVTAIL